MSIKNIKDIKRLDVLEKKFKREIKQWQAKLKRNPSIIKEMVEANLMRECEANVLRSILHHALLDKWLKSKKPRNKRKPKNT